LDVAEAVRLRYLLIVDVFGVVLDIVCALLCICLFCSRVLVEEEEVAASKVCFLGCRDVDIKEAF
jgi:hypothetical protein